LEYFAIQKGIDGTALALCIAAIAGLGGYGINEIYQKIRNKRR